MKSEMLSGRNIFITGGTGFLGKTLIDYLLEYQKSTGEAFEITVLSRNPENFVANNPNYSEQPKLRFIEGSLERLPEPDQAYTDVIHAAADTHWQGSGAEWISQIVNGTQKVLDFALKSGAKRFLHTSSGAIYGPQPDGLDELSEDYGGAPSSTLISSIYGQAKRIAEQLCTVYYHQHGLHTINARCFSFTSKHIPLTGPYALGNFIHDALHHDAIHVKGDGTAIRSYLDGEDMSRWLMAILETGKPGEAYNVGSNQGISMRNLANTVAQLLAPEKIVIIENKHPKNTERSRYIPAIGKANSLGLKIRYNLIQAIERTVSGLS